jgi:uncharacterized protein
MMTDESLTTEAILDAFATAGRVLPRAALKQAADRWPEVGPALVAMLEAVAEGDAVTDRTEAILFFGIYLMAQASEIRAFRPLCTIAAHDAQIERLIGDGVTEDLPLILARTYDGDPAPLRMLIEAADADEFARNASFAALSWLTATGRIDRDETARYLRDLHATLQPQDASWVWVGWQQAIARLGLDELVPLVEDAFNRGWVEPMALSLHHFHEDLQAARQTADPADVFDQHDKDDGRLNDIVDHLSGWVGFAPEQKPIPKLKVSPPGRVTDTIIHNPYRNVGRNDPCPCGSGKKFKKCCLDKVR